MINSDFSILNDNADIVKALYYRGILSTTDVSNFIGRSIPHVNKLLINLKDRGIIVEKGLATSSGGRKPLTYSIVPDSYNIISVAFDRFSMRLAAIDMQNNFIGDIKTNEIELGEVTADAVVNHIKDFVDQNKLEKEKILGIGITMPGFVDVVKGVNYTFKNLGVESLVDYIQFSVQIPVFIENDSTAIALAEQKFGLAAGCQNVMVVNLGWGVGLGMILNNQIFRGDNGLAGEFSHLPLFNNGRLCDCGKHGCLETEASFIAIENHAKDAVANGETTSLAKFDEINALKIIEQAVAGDRFAVKLISKAAYHIGQGLAVLIHLMNPGRIILSGKGATAGKLWLAPIQQALNEHCIPHLTGFTEIEMSELSDRAQLIGGGVLVVENIGSALQNKLALLENDYAEQN